MEAMVQCEHLGERNFSACVTKIESKERLAN